MGNVRNILGNSMEKCCHSFGTSISYAILYIQPNEYNTKCRYFKKQGFTKVS